MNYEGLTLDKEGGVAILTLNRPEKLNAISIPMVESLQRALDDVGKDNNLKVLIMTGAGRGFCTGMDVTAFSQVEEKSLQEVGDLMRNFTFPLYNLPQPTIAAINGVIVGAGLSIAMLCDLRIASEKATFTTGYARVGLIPDIGATYTLPRIVGTAKALELMITSDTFDAAEAQQMGLLSRVVPEADLMTAARELADKIAKGPSVAIKLMKQAVRRGIHNSLEQQIEFECFADYICFRTEDHKEAVNSFLEKREPVFTGK